jgi:hypothetical protein
MSRDIDLGKVIIVVNHRAVGVADHLVFNAGTISRAEMEALEQAKIITIVRPKEGKEAIDSLDGVSPVPVSFESFRERLEATADKDYIMPAKGWEVAVLHGLVALAADHPGVEMLHAETQAVIRRIREWCMAVFIDMGFSPGEAVFLNTAREGELTPASAPYCTEDTPCCDRRGQPGRKNCPVMCPCHACSKEHPCCDRRDEFNGLGSGPLSFTCPNGCSCHD